MGTNKIEIRDVNIIRYIQPFREGGSLPGLVDADDGFSYVIKSGLLPQTSDFCAGTPIA